MLVLTSSQLSNENTTETDSPMSYSTYDHATHYGRIAILGVVLLAATMVIPNLARDVFTSPVWQVVSLVVLTVLVKVGVELTTRR